MKYNINDQVYAILPERKSGPQAVEGTLVAYSESGVWAYIEEIGQRGKSGKTFIKRHHKVLTANLQEPIKRTPQQ